MDTHGYVDGRSGAWSDGYAANEQVVGVWAAGGWISGAWVSGACALPSAGAVSFRSCWRLDIRWVESMEKARDQQVEALGLTSGLSGLSGLSLCDLGQAARPPSPISSSPSAQRRRQSAGR